MKGIARAVMIGLLVSTVVAQEATEPSPPMEPTSTVQADPPSPPADIPTPEPSQEPSQLTPTIAPSETPTPISTEQSLETTSEAVPTFDETLTPPPSGVSLTVAPTPTDSPTTQPLPVIFETRFESGRIPAALALSGRWDIILTEDGHALQFDADSSLSFSALSYPLTIELELWLQEGAVSLTTATSGVAVMLEPYQLKVEGCGTTMTQSAAVSLDRWQALKVTWLTSGVHVVVDDVALSADCVPPAESPVFRLTTSSGRLRIRSIRAAGSGLLPIIASPPPLSPTATELPPMPPQVLSASAPSAPVLSFPPHGSVIGGSMDVPIWVGNVIFDWEPRGSPATHYQFELSSHRNFQTIPEVELPNAQPGYALDLNTTLSGPLPDGVYYWRVRALNTAGSSAWSTPREIRIDRTPPPPVTLHQPLASPHLLQQTRPTFTWSAAAGAARYRLLVSYLPDFSAPVAGYENRIVSGLSFAGSHVLGHPNYVAPLNGEFFWAVQPIDAAGNVGQATSRPSRVDLRRVPAPNAMIVSTAGGILPKLEWLPVAGATTYTLELANNPNFMPARTHTLTTNTYTLNRFDVYELHPSMGDMLRPGAVVFWRVRLPDEMSGYIDNQAFFIVDRALAAPTIAEPADGAVFNAVPHVHLIASSIALNTTAIYAEIQISTQRHFPSVNTFTTVALYGGDPVQLQTELPPSPHAVYYWRARLHYHTPATEIAAPFTPVRHFIYDTQPPTFLPLTTLRVSSLRPMLAWSNAAGAVRYTVDLMVSENWVTISPPTLTSLRFTPTRDLLIGENTLRIRAYDQAGNMAETITTVWVDIAQAPTASAVMPTAVTFRWISQPAYQRYALQIATDEAFQTLLDASTEVSGNAYTVTLPQGMYFWRVLPVNAPVSTQLPTRTFYVSPNPLSRATLRSIAQDNVLNLAEFAEASVPIICQGVLDQHSGLLSAAPYQLEFAADAAFQRDVGRVPLTCNGQPHPASLSPAQLAQRPFVRVLTTFADGLTLMSSSQRITVDLTPPTVPTRLSPPAGSRLTTTLPTLRWSASTGVRNTNGYRVEFFAPSSDVPFQVVHTSAPELATHRLAPTAFTPLPQTMVEWRVVAIDTAGNETASDRVTLTIHRGSSPAHHAYLTTTTPQFVFQRQPYDAAAYQLIISRNAALSDWHSQHTISCSAASSICAYQLPVDAALTREASYYWVIVSSSSTPTDWSQYTPAQFYVLAEADRITPPALHPVENDLDQVLNAAQTDDGITFAWDPPAGLSTVTVVGYELQISRSATFALLSASHTTSSSETTVTLPITSDDGRYFWRMRGLLNHGGHTPFSAAGAFTIDRTPPTRPVLIAPTSSIISTTQVQLIWRAVPDAARYEGSLNGIPFTTTNTRMTPSLPQGTHTLVIHAVDAAGNYSAPLTTSFTVNVSLLPSQGAVRRVSGTQLPIEFVWSAAAGHTGSYTLYLDADGDFTTIDTVDGLVLNPISTSSTRLQLPHLPEGIYRWWIGVGDESLPDSMSVFAFAQTRSGLPIAMLQPTAGDDLVNADEYDSSALGWQWAAGTSWQPTAYTVEISNTPTFARILRSLQTPSTTLDLHSLNLADGTYYWRVRTHFAQSFQSLSGARPFTLDRVGPLEAPRLLSPMPHWIFHRTAPAFSWAPPASTAYSRLDILSEDGTTLVRSYMTNQTQLAIPSHTPLTVGTYLWRVQTYDRAGNASPLSALRRFRVTN